MFQSKNIILFTAGAGSLLALILLIYFSAGSFKNNSLSEFDKILDARPNSSQRIFDLASLLKYSRENTEEMLRFFEKQHSVELLIATLPHSGNLPISELAAKLFSNWDIGRRQDGRGVLLLLSEREKKIKVEVGYGVEDVFTDLFCGYIEKKQLKTYFENNQVDEGLTAALEEFIGRAQGKLSDKEIKKKMLGELSGGAGIEKGVLIGEFTDKNSAPAADRENLSAPGNPEDLYKEWMQVLRRCDNNPALPIYSEATSVMFEYGRNMSRSMCSSLYALYSKPHTIREQGRYAVLLFPSAPKSGPVFFQQTSSGWKIDMVSTAKWVRYGYGNQWFLGGRNHPYSFAFTDLYSKYVRDRDYYDDYIRLSPVKSEYKKFIAAGTKHLQNNPDDYEVLVSLGELYFDLSVPGRAASLLQKAVKLKPKDPRAYRALGLMNRDMHVSPNTALKYLQKYAELAPNDAMAHRYIAVAYWRKAYRERKSSLYARSAEEMLTYGKKSEDSKYANRMIGYFYYKAKMYPKAKAYFEKVIAEESSNDYALKMLAKIEEISESN